jgi:RNA polymerase primary sigma factor
MALIKRARERGFEQENSREYLTYDEINIHLEEDKLDKDRMENILELMGDFGITVCDEAPEVETILKEGKARHE